MMHATNSHTWLHTFKGAALLALVYLMGSAAPVQTASAEEEAPPRFRKIRVVNKSDVKVKSISLTHFTQNGTNYFALTPGVSITNLEATGAGGGKDAHVLEFKPGLIEGAVNLKIDIELGNGHKLTAHEILSPFLPDSFLCTCYAEVTKMSSDYFLTIHVRHADDSSKVPDFEELHSEAPKKLAP